MAWIVKNDGSAEFRGPHSCRVEFQLQNTATGEIIRDRKTMRVSSHAKTEKARCIRERRAELESGLRLDASTITFGQYADEWLKMRKADPEIAPQTYSRDVYRVRGLKLHFGNMLIGEITRMDVKRFQSAIMTADENGHAPTISGKPLSGTTARGWRVTFKQIMQEAVRDELIAKNPCDDLKAPSRDTEEKDPLTPEQTARFSALLDAGTPRPTLVALRLCLFAGLRRSEVAGLKWCDYDANAGTIAICRSLDTETLDFKPPKTKAGNRTIPLDAGTVDYLNRYKTEQSKKLLEMGLSVPDSCICATAGTEYMHPENITRSCTRFGKANGFGHITPHMLRHTYCTLLFAAGVDLKTVQYLMGHDDPATTLKVYTHYVEANGIKAAMAIGALMDSLPTTNVVHLDKPKGRWGIKAVAV